MRALRRTQRIALAAVWSVFLLAAAVGVTLRLALRPEAIEAEVRRLVSSAFARPVSFSGLRFGWWRGVEILDLRVEIPGGPGPGGDQPAETWKIDRLRVAPSFWGLLRGKVEILAASAKASELSLRRDASGSWNALRALRPEALEALSRSAGPSGRWPAIAVEVDRARLEDEALPGFPAALELEGLSVKFRGGAGGAYGLGAFARAGSASVELAASVRASAGGPSALGTISVRRADLAALRAALPAELSRRISSVEIRGFLEATVEWEASAGGAFRVRGASGRLARAAVSSPELPYPVTGLEGEFRCGEDFVECTGIRGAFGRSPLSASGRAEFPGGLSLPARGFEKGIWRASLAVGSLEIEPRLRAAMPAELRDFSERYGPEGTFDVEVGIEGSFDRPVRPEDIRALVRFSDASIAFHKFPYRVRGLAGSIAIENGRFLLPAPIEARPGAFEGSLSGPGGDLRKCGDADVTIRLRSLPLDETLRAALPPTVLETWDAFQIAGSADAEIRVTRAPPEHPGADPRAPCAPTHVRISAVPRGARICYRKFPYEVTDISGRVEIDVVGKRVRFEGLEGRHGSAKIAAEGVLEHGTPYLFSLALSSGELPIDGDLRDALPPSERELVEDYGLGGTVRAGVQIRADAPGASRFSAELGAVAVRLSARRFPYPLDLVEGSVRIAEDGTASWSGLATAAGSKPYVVLGGRLAREGSVREVRLELDFDSVDFDDKLRDALPPHLERATSNMGLGGLFRGRVEIVRRTDDSRPGWGELRYEGKDVSVRSGSVDFGLKIRDLEARANFSGDLAGQAGVVEGEVAVQSGMFNRLRLSEGLVEFALGKELSRRAPEPGAEGGGPPAPGDGLRGKVAGADPKRILELAVRSQDLYGGRLRGRLFVDVGDGGDFAGEFVADGVQVSRAAGDVFETTVRRASGRAGGRVSFAGKNRDSRSIAGAGSCRIEDARLGEVPLFLDVGRLLFGEGAGSGHFREVRLEFRIEDGKFVADPPSGVEVLSPSLTLAGGGTMDFRGNLDLLLEAQILGVRIPLVDEIFSLLKKGLARISIAGNLSKPKVEFVTGAGMLRIGLPGGGGSKE